MSSLQLATASLTTSIIASSVESLLSFSTPSAIPTQTPDPLPTTIDDYDESGQTYPPMTTHWSVPLSCTWTYNVDKQPEPGATGAVAWLDIEPINGASTLSCYPDGMFGPGRTGVFSPGTCPNGWTTVSLLINTNEVKDKATTTAVCCSSEYSLDGNQCKRYVPTVLAVPISYNHSASTYDIMSSSTTTLYSATIAVYTIRALFQEADKEMLGLKDEDDIDIEKGKRSLSLNERIGIGVGVAIFVLLLIGAIVMFGLRKDRSDAKIGLHELNAMRHRRRHGDGEHGGHRMGHGSSHDAEPPPTYQASTRTNTLAGDESEDSSMRDEEIRVLRVQKAAIQRRIDELERVETTTGQDRNRDE